MAVTINILTHGEGAKVTFTNADGERDEPVICVPFASNSFDLPAGSTVEVACASDFAG